MTLLQPIYEATKLLSSSSHPTIEDLRTVFLIITTLLTEAQSKSRSIEARITEKITQKLDDYWDDLQSYFHEAVLLDPSTKFMTFKSSTDKYNARQMIHVTYQAYALIIEDVNQQVLRLDQTASACDYFRCQLKQTHNISTSSDVLDKYLNATDEDINILAYWKLKSSNS